MVNNSIVEASGLSPVGLVKYENWWPDRNWPDTFKTRVGPSGQRYCRPLIYGLLVTMVVVLVAKTENNSILL